MAQSFANVRLGAAALFLAAGLAGACGGDDSGGKDDPKTDSGTPVVKNDAGGVDAATPPSDAGRDATTPTGDAGDAGNDELAAALKLDGVDTSDRRAELVFAATCKRAQECSDPEWTASCPADGLMSYRDGVARGVPTACLDATLDSYACFATVATCAEYEDGCESAVDAFDSACAGVIGDDGGL